MWIEQEFVTRISQKLVARYHLDQFALGSNSTSDADATTGPLPPKAEVSAAIASCRLMLRHRG